MGMNSYSLDFFLGPGLALAFVLSTPAPRLRLEPVFGLDALAVTFPVGSLDEGWGVLEPE